MLQVSLGRKRDNEDVRRAMKRFMSVYRLGDRNVVVC
jgi:hypothetical protein